MADVTVTAADVRPLPGAIVRRYDAGGSLSAGDLVYIASDGDVEQADADAAASARGIGIVVADGDGGTSFSAGDRVDVVVLGPVAGFSSLTPATLLFASTTAGAIGDAAPTAGGDYVWCIGYAEAAAVVFVNPFTYNIDVLAG